MAAAEQFLPYIFSAMCLVGGISLILYPLIFLSLNESNTKYVWENKDFINFEDLSEHVTFWSQEKGTNIVDLKQQTISPSAQHRRPSALISGKNHRVLDRYLTASSSYDAHHGPRCSRLGPVKPDQCYAWGWAGKGNTLQQWIQVDLSDVHVIVAIHTKGRSLYDEVKYKQWVTRFMIEASVTGDDSTFTPHKNFVGNIDSDTLKVNTFEPHLFARFVRLSILEYELHPSIRWELYGYKIKD